MLYLPLLVGLNKHQDTKGRASWRQRPEKQLVTGARRRRPPLQPWARPLVLKQRIIGSRSIPGMPVAQAKAGRGSEMLLRYEPLCLFHSVPAVATCTFHHFLLWYTCIHLPDGYCTDAGSTPQDVQQDSKEGQGWENHTPGVTLGCSLAAAGMAPNTLFATRRKSYMRALYMFRRTSNPRCFPTPESSLTGGGLGTRVSLAKSSWTNSGKR